MADKVAGREGREAVIDVEAGAAPLSPHLSLPKDDRRTHDADVFPAQLAAAPESEPGDGGNMKVTFKVRAGPLAAIIPVLRGGRLGSGPGTRC